MNKLEVNKIKEIYPGHFFVLLDFPSIKDLYRIIDVSYKYIWNFKHIENEITWEKYTYNLYGKSVTQQMELNVRNIQLEYLILTDDFIKIIPNIRGDLNIIQTNIIPPPYLRLEKFEGKSRYNILRNKIDYLFELTMPSAIDYSSLISPNKVFLEKVISRLD